MLANVSSYVPACTTNTPPETNPKPTLGKEWGGRGACSQSLRARIILNWSLSAAPICRLPHPSPIRTRHQNPQCFQSPFHLSDPTKRAFPDDEKHPQPYSKPPSCHGLCAPLGSQLCSTLPPRWHEGNKNRKCRGLKAKDLVNIRGIDGTMLANKKSKNQP